MEICSQCYLKTKEKNIYSDKIFCYNSPSELINKEYSTCFNIRIDHMYIFTIL